MSAESQQGRNRCIHAMRCLCPTTPSLPSAPPTDFSFLFFFALGTPLIISVAKTSIKPVLPSFFGIVSFHHLSVRRWQDTFHPTSHPPTTPTIPHPQATGLGAAKGPDGESKQRTSNGWLDDTFIYGLGACCVIYGRGGRVDWMGVGVCVGGGLSRRGVDVHLQHKPNTQPHHPSTPPSFGEALTKASPKPTL